MMERFTGPTHRYGTLGWIAWGLATLGAINWGLRGAANFNLVHYLFGWNPNLERTAYVLVGLAGLLSLFRFAEFTQHRVQEHEPLGERIRRAV